MWGHGYFLSGTGRSACPAPLRRAPVSENARPWSAASLFRAVGKISPEAMRNGGGHMDEAAPSVHRIGAPDQYPGIDHPLDETHCAALGQASSDAQGGDGQGFLLAFMGKKIAAAQPKKSLAAPNGAIQRHTSAASSPWLTETEVHRKRMGPCPAFRAKSMNAG